MLELQITNQFNRPWPKGWRGNTKIMGVINVTPDSFSDGGEYLEPLEAYKKASECIAAGVDVIDVGGQSTRPGAKTISPEKELQRIMPMLKLLRKNFPNILISVDTFYSKVAKEVIEIGVDWINDISGGRLDPKIRNVVASSNCPYVITHSRGNSFDMNNYAFYNDVVEEVYMELMQNVEEALAAGISNKLILIDPGLGFAKNNIHNLTLLSNLEKFTDSQYPVLVGPSRKRFIGHVINEPDARKRIFGTAAVTCRCVQAKVDIIRVHDIKEINQTIKMATSLWPF
ncbi:dihydropteroate synthase [Prochlorococcus marinus]|uniref:dihydropteroate synthase n=1 Tax=Prochlorococcus marinus TaxID=1219 RepID=UPI001CEC1EE5|nr:dihydropteroate synthase [Prochlorococcus marinus]